MRLYLIRHGEAEDQHPLKFPDDAARPLTSEGIQELERSFDRLSGVISHPNRLISSPLLRAMQTAEIFARRLGYSEAVETSPALLPNESPQEAVSELRGGESIVLFGHLPHLPVLAAFLLGARNPLFTLEKGGLACIQVQGTPAFASGWLEWLLTPKLAR